MYCACVRICDMHGTQMWHIYYIHLWGTYTIYILTYMHTYMHIMDMGHIYYMWGTHIRGTYRTYTGHRYEAQTHHLLDTRSQTIP